MPSLDAALFWLFSSLTARMTSICLGVRAVPLISIDIDGDILEAAIERVMSEKFLVASGVKPSDEYSRSWNRKSHHD